MVNNDQVDDDHHHPHLDDTLNEMQDTDANHGALNNEAQFAAALAAPLGATYPPVQANHDGVARIEAGDEQDDFVFIPAIGTPVGAPGLNGAQVPAGLAVSHSDACAGGENVNAAYAANQGTKWFSSILTQESYSCG